MTNENLIINNKVKLFFASSMDFGNFGDLLSRYVVEKLSGVQVEKYDGTHTSVHLSAIGSILSRNEVCSPAVVWGSGFLSPQKTYKIKLTAIRQFLRGKYGRISFLATRGKLSQKIVSDAGYQAPSIYGDPALLMPFIYPNVNEAQNKGERFPKIAVILHRRHECFKDRFMKFENVKVIDIFTAYNDIEKFIDSIMECDAVLSSSLHGLIIANAYKKPCTRLKVIGNPIIHKAEREDFKFEDYLSGINACKVDSSMEDYVFNELILSSEFKLPLALVDDVINQSTVPKYCIDITNLVKVFPLPIVYQYMQENYIIK